MITIQDTIFMGTAAPASGGGGSITVDQTYDPISTNAQSGTAVAEALGTITSVQSVDNANTAVGAISPLKLWNGTEQEWNTGGGSQTWYCWDEFQGGVGVVGIWYTLDDPENITTETVLYSAPNVVDTSVTVTYGDYRSFSASNGHIGMYNARGNQTTTSSIGQAHPDWLCNIDEVGVKKGNTLIADLSSADNSTITKNNSNQLQTVGIINQNTSISAISQLKVWNGTEQEWNTGGNQTWYNWEYTSGGGSWTSETSGVFSRLNSVVYGDNKYIAVGSGNILSSPDGSTWTTETSGVSVYLNGVAYGNNKFVAVGTSGKILSSFDGSTWTKETSGVSEVLTGVTYGNNKYIAVGFNGTILSSPDGSTWTSETSGVSDNLNGVTYGDNKYIAVGSGNILSSPDGSTWTSETSGVSVYLNGVAYGNNKFVAVGSGTILSSSNGSTWTSETSGSYSELKDVTYGNNKYIAVGFNGTILSSPDGSTWTSETSGVSNNLNGVTYGNNKYIVVGDEGDILSYSAGVSLSCYTLESEPTTASTVYSEPSVTSALTITAVGTGTITLSDTNTYDYNASGNQTTISSVGQAHPDYLCFINGVGVKIGTTTIAQVNAS